MSNLLMCEQLSVQSQSTTITVNNCVTSLTTSSSTFHKDYNNHNNHNHDYDNHNDDCNNHNDGGHHHHHLITKNKWLGEKLAQMMPDMSFGPR